MPDRSSAHRESLILLGIFVGALLLHFCLATRNWTNGFMIGHEFRQTQTAITSYYIDQQNNFSPLYETPIVGKPWVSILMEVPVYEWSVVLLKRATGLSLIVAARTVSLTCFYLALPALYLLLARLGLSPARRLLPLVLILCCPVYIFYSRTFLMESMELMCCAWFLVGFIGMMDRRRWTWFLLATVAGTGAALIKSVTLAVWLLPAAGYGAWMLWADMRHRRGWSAALLTIFWGLAGVTVPLGALRLWIVLTDPIKAAHASAWIFTSKNLSQGNWGLADFAARFSAKTWGVLMERWSEAVLPPWVVGVALLTGLLALPAQRWRVAGVASVFFLAQLLFPFAYAYQDYYFYACAVFLTGGFGFALIGLLDSRLPRWLCWLLIAALPAAELDTYRRFYYQEQIVVSEGGFYFTSALRDLMPKGSVIIVAGADWSAIIPYYAQRRALLIRNGLEADGAYLDRAFGELADEDVSALVMVFDQRTNTVLRDLVVNTFHLEPTPTFYQDNADVYCSRRYGDQVRAGLREKGYLGDLHVPLPVTAAPPKAEAFSISGGLAERLFPHVSPVPFRGYFTFGAKPVPADGEMALEAHPDSDLWLRPARGATRIEWDYGMFDSAWTREGAKTDGVELIITGLSAAGRRQIFKRTLDPVAQPKDRGRQRESISYQPQPGEILQFSTRPRDGSAFDWVYWSRIEVK